MERRPPASDRIFQRVLRDEPRGRHRSPEPLLLLFGGTLGSFGSANKSIFVTNCFLIKLYITMAWLKSKGPERVVSGPILWRENDLVSLSAQESGDIQQLLFLLRQNAVRLIDRTETRLRAALLPRLRLLIPGR